MTKVNSPRKIWTWNLDWVLPFASNWSIVNMFCALNCISPVDIVNRFCDVSEDITEKPNSSRFSKYNYNSSSLFSTSAYRDLVGEAIFITSNLSSILPPTHITKFTSFEFLRFCPQCLNLGYHSSLYQLLFIHKCPIHGIELQTVCTSCNQPIKYEIERNNVPPYGCKKCKTLFWIPYSLKYKTQKNLFKFHSRSLTKLWNTWRWLEQLDLFKCVTLNTCRPYGNSVNPAIVHGHWQNILPLPQPNAVAYVSVKAFTHSSTIHSIRNERCHEIVSSDFTDNGKVNDIITDIKSIFKSIKRHIFKSLLPKTTHQCYSKKCLITSKYISLHCPQVNGISKWLDFWTHCKGHRNLVKWEIPIIPSSITDYTELQNWLVLHIFALEVYWSFWYNYRMIIQASGKSSIPYKEFEVYTPNWFAKAADGKMYFHSWPPRDIVPKLQESLTTLFGSEWRCTPIRVKISKRT
jgi:hypothetical protein